jgi:hypothetical protein
MELFITQCTSMFFAVSTNHAPTAARKAEITDVSALFNSGGLFFIIYHITSSVVALWVHDQFVPSEQRDWLGKLFWVLRHLPCKAQA